MEASPTEASPTEASPIEASLTEASPTEASPTEEADREYQSVFNYLSAQEYPATLSSDPIPPCQEECSDVTTEALCNQCLLFMYAAGLIRHSVRSGFTSNARAYPLHLTLGYALIVVLIVYLHCIGRCKLGTDIVIPNNCKLL